MWHHMLRKEAFYHMQQAGLDLHVHQPRPAKNKQKQKM